MGRKACIGKKDEGVAVVDVVVAVSMTPWSPADIDVTPGAAVAAVAVG